MISISAYEALEEICSEIKVYGEPANPALGTQLKNAYSTLKAGGAVVGFYGQGKSLLANLTALAELLQGRPAIVVKANQVLTGRTKLGDISTCRELNRVEEMCGEIYHEWLGKVIEMREEKAVRLDCEEKVEVEGEGLDLLDALIVNLKSKNFTIIVDELERLVEQPTAYGFKDVLDFREQFFNLVDRRSGVAGFAIPVSFWTIFDIQIKSRIAPVYFISADMRPEDMREFMRRKHGHMPKEFEPVEFRNPRVVATILRELASGKSPADVIKLRLEVLRALTYYFAKKDEVRKALFVALTAAWLKQSVYMEFNTSTLSTAISFVNTYLEEKIDKNVNEIRKILIDRRKIRKGLVGYNLSPSIVQELEELARGGGDQKKLLAQLGKDVAQMVFTELGVV